jgi:ribosomal protein S18 acetylase RimI-like enzyme
MSAAEQLVPAVVILESHGARVEGQRTTWRYVVQVDGEAQCVAEGRGPLGRVCALGGAEAWCRINGYPTPTIEYADGPARPAPAVYASMYLRMQQRLKAEGVL